MVSLTSRYSYFLYLYLENNRFRRSWTVPLEELKEVLACTAKTYGEYKRFNDLVLKKCEKELNSKTDLRYSYAPVRRGRRVRRSINLQKSGQEGHPNQDENDGER